MIGHCSCYLLPKAHRGCGFTLVELLVALVLMSFITVLMASGLRATGQGWEKITDRQNENEHRFQVDQFLRRHINSARFPRIRDEEGVGMVGFFGTASSLHFLAPMPVYENNGVLYWWNLKIITDDKTREQVLELQYLPYRDGEPVRYDQVAGLSMEGVSLRQIEVARQVRISSIRYYGATGRGGGGESWLTEWPAGSDLAPRVIRLQIEELNRQGEYEAWQEIAVAPRFRDQEIGGGHGD
ncbi:prepilin-type N-terminal cleavage/methylation domain-containing protein [Parahaliea maris]|uniref:Prepilin-type N-terminal cleavage/methylation domain-containing protein n=1 Tax=Parahaliea maris TaxID=2716870 RepID=A0A5C8ZRZ6_9GAMM|nr:prepilin-type N-terminal cleavage/methylation domain-containing protein [Parahaliea maris]TXS91216.1 prepilin-type N-terminal cleavage/methylation domain-containing protein [Parahaliea maris]